MTIKNPPLSIGEYDILAGEAKYINLPITKLYTDTEISMPVYVSRAKKSGPTVFVSAAIHGDEINGIEIIRRLILYKQSKLRRGTLIFVPIVNVYGVLEKSRYMPDRRDLNRSFPGYPSGSLTGRLAHQFLHEIVAKCDYGIDLHTGAIHRSNLPQIRANLSNEGILGLAEQFNAPVILHSNLRDGSLRQCASDVGCKTLLYEAGEALRFDEYAIRTGVRGVLNILRYLDMISPVKKRKQPLKRQPPPPVVAHKSRWHRASHSGVVTSKVKLGDSVKKGDLLAEISTPFGKVVGNVISKKEGIVIGQQNIPLVQEGDAMFHIACFDDSHDIAETLELHEEHIMPTETELTG